MGSNSNVALPSGNETAGSSMQLPPLKVESAAVQPPSTERESRPSLKKSTSQGSLSHSRGVSASTSGGGNGVHRTPSERRSREASSQKKRESQEYASTGHTLTVGGGVNNTVSSLRKSGGSSGSPLAKTTLTKSLQAGLLADPPAKQGSMIVEDLESRDQIAELTLHTSQVHLSNNSGSHSPNMNSSSSGVNSSLTTLQFQSSPKPGSPAGAGGHHILSMGAPLASNQSSKQVAKSLPKISSVFRKQLQKGVRASSEQPNIQHGANMNGVNVAMNQLHTAASTATSMATLSPVSNQNKPGHLSAYEISPTSNLNRTYHLEDFHIVRRVGKGGFASVFLVRLKSSTGRYYALKAIKKADVLKLKQEKQVMNEKNILKGIKHSFIVELYQTFQDTFYLYMVLEYIDGGDLFSYLRRVQRFGEEDAKFYVAEVLISLQYLHSENIVYRDLKPENILLDTTGHIKLADFGFAKIVRHSTQSFCGTPDYIAPEIIANKPYKMAVDWWSLGVLIFELTSGKTPFGDDTSEKIYDNIQAGRIKWHPLVKGTCKDVVRCLLENDSGKRLGSHGDGEEIRQHPYFKTLNWKKVEARQSTPPFLPACDAPEVIERERAARGNTEDYVEMLKSGGNAGGSWLAAADPFSETFKDF
ncbi:camp-dependent protein kinase catalytic subunit [Blyttiomyces sp. JEL0837]|nr:camp-dependent protein kinase catalytic subunit [Blyttiomyces sp. JEL0837]